MTDDQLSEFEDLARRAGRKSIPPGWRSEILESATAEATPDAHDDDNAKRAALWKAIEPTEATDDEAVLAPALADDRGTLEERIRKAERRTMWSMAACFLVSLLLIALLFRPRLEPRAAESRTEENSARNLSTSERERWSDPVGAPLLPSGGDLPDVPPPPPPPAGKAALAGQNNEAIGGFLIREAAINDVFQMLAKRAGKQYFHNNKVAGPEFKVSGHLNDGDPLQQMEDLALARGLSVYQKGNTVYALTEEQMSKVPGDGGGQGRPSAVEPTMRKGFRETRDKLATRRTVEEERALPNGVRLHGKSPIQPLVPSVNDPRDLAVTEKDEKNSELAVRKGRKDGDARKPLGPSNDYGDPLQPVGELTVTPAVVAPPTIALTNRGQHADVSSGRDIPIAGGGFASGAPTEGRIALDRLPGRKEVTLSDASTIGGVSLDFFTGVLPSREAYEAENADYFPLSSQPDSGLVAGVRFDKNADNPEVWYGAIPQEEERAGTRGWNARWAFENALPEADGEMVLDDNARSVLVDAEQAAGEEATISLIDRVPILTSTINETEISNQVTEEVRYSVDTKDPVGDPTTTREIGVTVGVTPTLLADGSIRMKMRPRSAQMVEEIISQSGNRYPQVSESMLESIARVPEGHSLVLGGFYGQVKQKDDNKVPLLGDVPVINFFFKGKETAKEAPSLLFVATPTSSNGQVATEVKILSVNSSAGERTGVDWTASLGKAGLAIEAIGRISNLFEINKAVEVANEATAGSDGPIVLSPAQIESVLRALNKAGLVTQISNPTLITSRPEETEVRKRQHKALNDLEENAAAEPFSTFSLHVSDVSFKLAKAALARGEWPAADQIRVEEFVNAFDYGDPAPNQKEKVSCHLEQAAHPFLQQRNLLRVSMKTAALGRSAETPLRLTVLLDNSGSMDRADREDSVKNAFRLLANQLTPQDQVTLIGFARTPRLLADRLAGNRVAELAKVVESTPSEGGTNLELALELGIAKAKEQMLEGGQNRIILLTDGAANLGNARPEALARLVEQMRQQEIAFDACGVGAEGLNDEILESLTRKGDGRYYFLDQPEDADAGFARQIAGALRPAARNVKVQMRFNPNRVGRYKLYGFEKHRLKKEDFRNDSVDAAELAAEEAGNAIYQVELLPEGSGEIGTVSVRFQDTVSGRMIERVWTIPYDAQVPRLEDAAASLRLASGAALLGEKLKGSLIGESVEMARLGKLMNSLTGDFPADRRVKELVQMANIAREMSGE